jgi:hypothetical protein
LGAFLLKNYQTLGPGMTFAFRKRLDAHRRYGQNKRAGAMHQPFLRTRNGGVGGLRRQVCNRRERADKAGLLNQTGFAF